ncbi:hypothetical protein Pmar_PMAR006671 [Perkinsus marinus ATCC 50983]|uniref:Uncharacterized protein n=1 Tax=Perkinsus marinus (strain ATCC 50983 / TXsc) TaxID=423536 RepID=C5LLX7_PERM5|nr:hypothetical protein Pmar_PMAR006671 [Perkinsus marinus ATCC 50983]EER02349.1 hypothetical protein Pmar_PMAR006671 [Perkinsus marinus ATCC 50983]|eukprot:XP_002769631.1 hypothetical protein Pmar_PMAR006671 [Perkinsus marinus ATCC 50983]
MEADTLPAMAINLVKDMDPKGYPSTNAHLVFCCRRHCEEGLFKLMRQAADCPIREGTLLFVGRSDKSFTSRVRDGKGRRSGLTVNEAKYGHLLGHNKTVAVTKALHQDSTASAGSRGSPSKYLPAAFKLRADEWCKTSWEAVDRAHRGAGTYWADEDPGMYKKLREAPATVDGVFDTLKELSQAYSQDHPRTSSSRPAEASPTSESRKRRLEDSWY